MYSKAWAGWLVIAFLLFATLSTPAALAVQTQTGDSVYIPPGQIQGPLFVSGNSVVVDADVEGDVFAAGQSVVINGKVNGDVMAAGQSVRITAAVDGDVRSAANDITIQSAVSQSLTAAGNNIRLEPAAVIGKDALLFGNNLDLLGQVNRQVLGASQSFRLTGSIGSDLKLWEVNNLTLSPSAVIGGNLIYKSPREAQIASGARVSGENRWEQSVIDKATPSHPRQPFSWIGLLMWLPVVPCPVAAAGIHPAGGAGGIYRLGAVAFGDLALDIPGLNGHRDRHPGGIHPALRLYPHFIRI
jgi:cytoskeletal protein CcmA (bactofilin family)